MLFLTLVAVIASTTVGVYCSYEVREIDLDGLLNSLSKHQKFGSTNRDRSAEREYNHYGTLSDNNLKILLRKIFNKKNEIIHYNGDRDYNTGTYGQKLVDKGRKEKNNILKQTNYLDNLNRQQSNILNIPSNKKILNYNRFESGPKHKFHHRIHNNNVGFKDKVEYYDNPADLNQQALRELMSQSISFNNPLKSQPQNIYHQSHVQPSNLLDFQENERVLESSDSGLNLNKFSRVYVILNPQSLTEDINKNKITELTSEVLSLVPEALDDQQGMKEHITFKEIVLNDDSATRRLGRNADVKVKGFGRDSLEDDHVPKKRLRSSDYGGYRGGGAGRTAIPYVRHRGDIYEEDD